MHLRTLFTATLILASGLIVLACDGGGTETPGGSSSVPTGGTQPDVAGPAQEPIEISFWHAISQRHEVALNDIIEQFQADHPNVTINAVYQGNYTDLRTALFAAMSTSSRPVMSQMYESWTSQFDEAGLIRHVQDFIDSDPSYGEEDLSDFFPSFLDNNTWDGEVVTLPFNKSVYLLYVNLDMLEAAGLEIPTTWDDLQATCLALTDAENNHYGFGARPFMETYTPFFLMAGGEFFVDGELDLTGGASVATLELLIQLVHRDRVCYIESDYLTSAFANQSVAMFVGSIAGLPYTNNAVGDAFRWTAAPLPQYEDLPPRVLSQGTNVGIYTGHSPEVEAAAWEFIKFLTNSESSAHFAQVSGYVPVRRSSLQVPEYVAYLDENPNIRIATEQLEYAVFEPRMPVWESIRDTLNRQIGQLLTNPQAQAVEYAAQMQRAAEADLED